MWNDRRGRTFQSWVADEWRCATAPVRQRWKIYGLGFIAAGLAFSVVSAVVIRPPLSDLPLVFVGGFVNALRYVGVLAALWVWLMAYIAHRCIFDWAETRWLVRERTRRPNQSFDVPHWRFWAVAIVSSSLLFVALLVPLLFLLVGLPESNATIARTLALWLPGEP
jgi:hypothetical protein